MRRTHKLAACIIVAVASSLPVLAYEAPKPKTFSAAAKRRVSTGALWRSREIRSLNLIYGPGGKEHQPAGTFTFVKEDKGGTAPKFEVIDQQGVRWKAKLGEETKSETAASRLVWAAGYFTDEDYYLPKLRVKKLAKLSRGRQFVSADGVLRGVRLERSVKGQKKGANWSWFKNPFVGTKEFDGLRILMALINNWDLKEVNNAIYGEKGQGPRYVVSDLGASFGETGNSITRSKSNLDDYAGTEFVQKVTPEYVDFFLSSRPFFPTVVDVPNYLTRTKMQDVAKHIPRTHAKWLGQLLGQLSAEQIRDCFRAAGYSQEEVAGFAKVVQGRIADLNRL
jgi:hypothetical protein